MEDAGLQEAGQAVMVEESCCSTPGAPFDGDLMDCMESIEDPDNAAQTEDAMTAGGMTGAHNGPTESYACHKLSDRQTRCHG